MIAYDVITLVNYHQNVRLLLHKIPPGEKTDGSETVQIHIVTILLL